MDEKSLGPRKQEDLLRIRIVGLHFNIVLSKFNLDVYLLYLNSKLHSILLPA